MKNNFDCTLSYTGTDSLMYHVYTKDIYYDLKMKINKKKNLFDDINDYVDNSKFMKLGLFKDECEGKIIKSFVGLKSKLYSLLFEDNSIIAKCKGVNKSIIKKEITYEDYEKALFTFNKKFVEFNKFKSLNHNIMTISMKKLCLDNNDDKRYQVDGIHTLALGHYKSENEVKEFQFRAI